MSKELRDAYDTIAEDYLSKKQPPWHDFERFLEIINQEHQSTVIDIGAGNGRNLLAISSDFPIAFDLSFELLLGYIGPVDGQKVAGALPHLPFRSGSSGFVISIAVIHHITPEEEVLIALEDINRISTVDAKLVFSVWRRWRTGLKQKLIKAIQVGEDLDPLINHRRPWYNSQREIQAIRFYHYYTFKELYYQLQQTGFKIITSKYLGGRHDDANIFVEVSIQNQRE